MSLATPVWQIVFDEAEHNEHVRAALAADIAKRRERTWTNVILPALEGPGAAQQRVDCEAATAPAYPQSPAGEAENPFLSDSPDLPGGGARLAALHVGGVR